MKPGLVNLISNPSLAAIVMITEYYCIPRLSLVFREFRVNIIHYYHFLLKIYQD